MLLPHGKSSDLQRRMQPLNSSRYFAQLGKGNKSRHGRVTWHGSMTWELPGCCVRFKLGVSQGAWQIALAIIVLRSHRAAQANRSQPVRVREVQYSRPAEI